MLPPTILTEVVAQVGAILILAKPENRQRLPFFAGIERVRYRRPVHVGDVLEIEATVLRLRSKMGRLKGIGRVDGKIVIEGTMTFALGPAAKRPARSAGSKARCRSRLAASTPAGKLDADNAKSGVQFRPR